MPRSPGPRSLATFRLSLARQLRRHRRLLASLLVAWAAVLALGELRPAPPPQRQVTAAAHDLPAGSVITLADLTTINLSEPAVPPGSISDPTLAVGHVLSITIPARMPIITSMLVSGESLRVTTQVSGRPLVAIPVRLTDAGAATLLVAGDLVDVWATRTAADGAPVDGSTPSVAVRVAASARVLAVPHPRSSASTSGGDASTGGLVVLAVPGSVVPELAYAAASARLAVTVLAS